MLTAELRTELTLRLGLLKLEVRDLEERLGLPRTEPEGMPQGVANAMLGLVIASSADFISVHQPNGDYVYASPNCHEMFGWRAEEMIGRSAYEFFHKEDLERVARDHAGHGSGDDGKVRYRLRCQSGEFRWVETRSRTNAVGGLIVAVTRDVQADQEHLEQLKEQALQDILTRLPNRHALQEALELEVQRSQRHETPLAVVFFDVDRFKEINDTRGHAFGDEVLATLAECIRTAKRSYDIAGRWGGDEFLIVLPHTTAEEALAMAHRLRGCVRLTLTDVTLSMGVSSNRDAQTAHELLTHADAALYTLKRRGGNAALEFEG